MTISARLIAVLVLSAALLPAAPARAFDGPGCGGAYTKSMSCVFAYRGSPLIVQGDSQSSGTTSVHVFITLSGYPELGSLFDCSGQGSGFAKCDKGLPDETTGGTFPPQVSTFYLVCHVEGSGAGQYYCQTGKY